jgi:hypothetical protein
MDREELVKYVKALGQEVIDRAEDLVGDGDGLTNSIDIWLHVPIPLDSLPTIQVMREHASKECFEILMNSDS